MNTYEHFISFWNMLPSRCNISQKFLSKIDGIVTFFSIIDDLEDFKNGAFSTAIDFLQYFSLIRSQNLAVANVIHTQASGIVVGSFQFIVFDVIGDGFKFVLGQTVQIGIGFGPTIDLENKA